MELSSTRLPYRQTGVFSSLALDYIDQSDQLRALFSYPASIHGVKEAISAREKFKTDRKTLTAALEAQYKGMETGEAVRKNISSLGSPKTFTVTTAHQNNLFTGPLYFIYKIIHAIKLSEHLKSSLPGYDFVPVFYMGSEDADSDELNHFYLNKEKITWETGQRGAVGRMNVDPALIKIIDRIEGELSVHPHGKELLNALRSSYEKGLQIHEATFRFVNFLFGAYGLVVLQPDNPALKKQLLPIFEEELLSQPSSAIVETSIKSLEKHGYKVQAHPREINLFYLKDDLRERIELVNSKNGEQKWQVLNSNISFTKKELLEELRSHPERFSPNVILRGIYQAIILPDVVFIGGGGELAYWLQLQTLFEKYKTPFPVLVLRNSYLVIERKWREKIASLGFGAEDFFLGEDQVLSNHVMQVRGHELKLNGSLTEVEQLYDLFKKQAAAIDPTLENHVEALRSQAIERLLELEKKMVRAEKRKFTDQQRQIHSIKENLFPGNGLQERRENILYYYAKWGRGFLDALLKHALNFEQEFTVLSEK